ncbi:MAG: YggT family protein [Chloroflexi bacterium]|nr:YggT family protein [Chloroflexota bacterium]
MNIYIYNFILILFQILNLAILARVILSWVNISPDNPIIQVIYQITEPIMAPLRRYIPPIGMIDITPIVALILLQVIENVLISLIRGY